jgi:lipoprotein-releasing system ATP-binding protein
MPIIELEGVYKAYLDGETFHEVLHGLSFKLMPGEFVALVGPSGSGKSTLLQLMGALDRPSRGSIRFDGRPFEHADDFELTAFRSRRLGFIFQFHHLLPEFTAAENVMMPSAAQRGKFTPDARIRALELLDAVGLSSKADARAETLSGGQKQRVAIARALMNRPGLVLADEPTGNLDRESGTQAFELMERINRQTGTTFLICTHDEALALRCRRQLRLVDGRLERDERQPGEAAWIEGG